MLSPACGARRRAAQGAEAQMWSLEFREPRVQMLSLRPSPELEVEFHVCQFST